MADAARDQRETTLALRGDMTEPGADAGGALVLVTTQQNAVTCRDPFETREPPKEFSRDDVPRIAGESELQHLERCYILLAAQYEYALQQSRFEHNARLAHWREKEKALDDLETARKEIARLNEVLQNDLRAQRDSAITELALKKRPRVKNENIDADAETFQSADGVLVDAEGFITRLPGEDSLAYHERCYNLLLVEYLNIIREANRMKREVSKTREKNRCLEDELNDARKEIARLNEVRAQRDSAVSELRVALGKLEVKLEAAQTENARLHQMNLELVTARHDALLSDIVRPKKRPRVDDDAAANQ